jgi:hypothetical protein
MKVEMRRCVFLLAAVLLVGCGGVSGGDYVSRNEALVASLPVFPGAVKAHEISTRRAGGYTTMVVYRVPRGTTDGSVLRFYATRLGRRGWRSVLAPPVRRFTKGRALVAVNTAFLTREQRRLGERVYKLVVDYRANRG